MMFSTSTSEQKWIFWTSLHWEHTLIMCCQDQAKDSTKEQESPQINDNKIMQKMSLTHKIKYKARITNLMTTSPNHMQKRVRKIQKRTLKSGVGIVKFLGITPMNVITTNHC